MILPPLPPLLITLGISLLIIALGIRWAIIRQFRESRAMLKEPSQALADSQESDLAPAVYSLGIDEYYPAFSEMASRDVVLSER
jgi:hypothetical protein